MAVFDAEERAAMRERAKEAKAEKGRAAGLQAVQEAIAKLTGSDRRIAERLHAVISEAAPALEPRTWYGQPAYARDGAVVVFFQAAEKFKTRYLTLGFQDAAALDEGAMWPTSFAITEFTDEVEREVARLVRRAAG
jgi:uncharacterized protein YdhG (YjbR/CyaY superfamily)